MVQDIENYEIDNKKYTVITTCNDNSENIDKLYDILCEFVISKLGVKI